jgi:hypothetical protein
MTVIHELSLFNDRVDDRRPSTRVHGCDCAIDQSAALDFGISHDAVFDGTGFDLTAAMNLPNG